MGSGWARLGVAVGGALIGGYLTGGASIGMSAGFLAGSYVGSMIFPTDYETGMPPVHDYPVQSSAIGIPIPIVRGTSRVAGNVIWMSDLVSYQIKHSAGGGKGGGDEQASYETRYRRSFVIAICEGEAKILRAWKGKTEIAITEFTSYSGDDNSGISTLIGESYAEYSNICLAYFEDYELGNSQALPNFIFEVAAGIPEFYKLVAGGDSYTDAPPTCAWHFDNDGTLLKKLLSYPVANISSISRDAVMDRIDLSFYCCYWNYTDSKGEIHKFDKDGEIVTSWGTNGVIQYPSQAICASCAVDSSGNLYVGIYHHPAQATHDILYKYDSSGNLLWSAQSSTLGNIRWVSHIIIKGGFGYLVENDVTWKAWKFSLSDGTFLQQYVPSTGAPRQHGMDVDDFGFVYVTNSEKIFRYKNDGTGTHTVNLDEAYPIYTGVEGLIVKSGAVESATIVYAGGHKRNAMTSLNENNIWKYDYNFANCLGTKLLGSGYSSSVFRLSQDDDDTILVIYTPTGYYHTIYQLDSDLSIIRTWNLASYRNFNHSTRHSSIITEAYDYNFAQMIKDLLIDERYGGYQESDLIAEDFDSVIAYCETNNLKGSISIAQQKPLPDWISYICSHFQGYFYEIGSKIGLNCYRSQNSVLSLVHDDLLRDGDEPPVHITKRPYSSTFNRLEATWTNRDNNYKTAVVPAFDRIDQRDSGQVRTKTLDLKMIHNNELASIMAWRIFIDQIYRFSQYTFKLGYKSMLLEVGDVIDVTDGHLLVAKKMRVMSITEEKDGRRALITAVEDIADFYPAISYAIQESEATPDTPIVLTDGTIVFREHYTTNKLHLSIIPGGEQCNGFYIYRSYDDASYDLVGKAAIGGVTGGEVNSTGTIQSQINLPAHTAVIHRKNEFFDVNIGILTDLDTAITDDNFFNNRKLARIGDEIIGYKTCVESSVEGIWRVSNLIRGLFGTEAVAHVSGETFNTLDIDFTYTLQESDIGKTLYFKVVSFYAAKIQLTSEVSSQNVVISGKYRTPLPISLMRINGREGLSNYKTVDVILDWYFCSKTSGFGRGGYGNALWGAYMKDPLLERVKVEIEEEDGTPITDSNYELDAYGEPPQLEILEADRNGKNPIVLKLSPMSNLLGDSRQITIEKV